MFALGGALCSPLLRQHGHSDLGDLSAVEPLDRALVVGGAADPLVDDLLRRDVDVTIVEPLTYVDEADALWSDRSEVHGVSDRNFTDDFAANWYDLIALPGGVLQTGGRFGDVNDQWANDRLQWLEDLRCLLSDRGVMVFDDIPSPHNLLRVVACSRDENGLSVAQGSVIGDSPQLTLRTSRYGPDGIFTSEKVEVHVWLPICDKAYKLLNAEAEA